MPPFLRLSRLLNLGLYADVPSPEFKALLPETDADWIDLFEVARNNRAIAPLSYIFSHKSEFGAMVGEEERAAMRVWHEALAFRALEVRKQITELAELTDKTGDRMVLLKGAARLFDNLYPDISCRYSIDVDPLIKNPALFYQFQEIGYEPYDDSSFNMAPIKAGDISSALTAAYHHLPPLYRNGYQASVELHTRAFSNSHSNLAIPDIWAQAIPVDGLPSLLLPSTVHQIIVNVVHTLLHSLAKQRFSLSVRDLFEGHRLYSTASDAEKKLVRMHFSDRGYERDFDLWSYICHRIFENAIYEVPETRFYRDFFERLTKTQSNPEAAFKYHLWAKIKAMIFFELTNWGRLKIRIRHLRSAAFWKRVGNSVRSARSGRQ